jgi:hypothetical protein
MTCYASTGDNAALDQREGGHTPWIIGIILTIGIVFTVGIIGIIRIAGAIAIAVGTSIGGDHPPDPSECHAEHLHSVARITSPGTVTPDILIPEGQSPFVNGPLLVWVCDGPGAPKR